MLRDNSRFLKIRKRSVNKTELTLRKSSFKSKKKRKTCTPNLKSLSINSDLEPTTRIKSLTRFSLLDKLSLKRKRFNLENLSKDLVLTKEL